MIKQTKYNDYTFISFHFVSLYNNTEINCLITIGFQYALKMDRETQTQVAQDLALTTGDRRERERLGYCQILCKQVLGWLIHLQKHAGMLFLQLYAQSPPNYAKKCCYSWKSYLYMPNALAHAPCLLNAITCLYMYETSGKSAVARPQQLHSGKITIHHCITLHDVATFCVY